MVNCVFLFLLFGEDDVEKARRGAARLGCLWETKGLNADARVDNIKMERSACKKSHGASVSVIDTL
jgi:hypothetical protein